MLAFNMPMPMTYGADLTALSMMIAVLVSGFALFLLKDQVIQLVNLVFGGILLGLGIAAMHYTGMAAMNMKIQYVPVIFGLSVLIAILASEAALYLALKSNEGRLRSRIRLKLMSAFIMGAAICGMHYTGMAAAVFIPDAVMLHQATTINPQILSITIALVALFILSIAFAATTYKEILNFQAIKLAHQGGMAEVATNVLHNVGNALNNINMSASIIEKCVMNTELSGLTDLHDLIEKHKNNLSEFVSSSRGVQLPGYIKILSDCWQNENAMIKRELSRLISNIEHVKEIVATQQSLSIMPHMEQETCIDELLDEAILMSDMNYERTKIVIQKKYEKVSPVYANKVKVVQILINLIRNAKHSLLESKEQNKVLILKTSVINNKLISIQVADNGVGIPAENMQKIFTHGFTTKRNGHGFGLHASAIACKEMGGSLKAYSEGVGRGAVFTLEIPYKNACRMNMRPFKQRSFLNED
jgi:NO-binding membrane sensor protein with MHYT domain/two-component sensor histidine kinase